MLEGRRALELVRPHLGTRVEDLNLRFAAVAADLDSGREVWLREGDVFEAVRASVAVPGILTPARLNGRVLVDGGIVNPIPVTAARALGASFVLAVNVLPLAEEVLRDVRRRSGSALPLAAQLLRRLPALAPGNGAGPQDAEATGLSAGERRGLVDVVSRAAHVAQCQIAALRIQDDEPEFLLTVPVPSVGLFEFDRSSELIEAGRAAAERALPELRAALERAAPIRERVRRWVAASE
jgi:NTE family protein